MAKPAVEIVPITGRNGETINLALGLTWKRVVSQSADDVADAKKVAKSAGSNHILIGRGTGSGPVRIYGHGNLPKYDGDKVFSAAYAFQLQRSEEEIAILALRVGDDRVWLCAVSEGLISKIDVVLSLEDAEKRFAEFMELRSDMADRIVTWGDCLPGSRSIKLEDLASLAANHYPAATAIEKLVVGTSVPRPVLYAAGVLCILLLARQGWKMYEEKRKAAELAALEAEKVPELSPDEVWKKALAGWTASTQVAGFKSIEDALNGVGELQTSVSGWTLGSVRCVRPLAGWNCQAEYRRERARRATADQFQSALKGKDRTIDWKTLDTAVVSFQVPTATEKVDLKALPKVSTLDVPLMSALQRSAGVFTSVGDRPKFAAVPIALPKRPDGTAYVLDMSAVKPMVLAAQMNLAGPVRSVLALRAFNVSWTAFTINFKALDQPTANDSAAGFTELKGDIYAIKD